MRDTKNKGEVPRHCDVAWGGKNAAARAENENVVILWSAAYEGRYEPFNRRKCRGASGPRLIMELGPKHLLGNVQSIHSGALRSCWDASTRSKPGDSWVFERIEWIGVISEFVVLPINRSTACSYHPRLKLVFGLFRYPIQVFRLPVTFEKRKKVRVLR